MARAVRIDWPFIGAYNLYGETLQQNYTGPVVGEILGESRKALEWIRAQY